MTTFEELIGPGKKFEDADAVIKKIEHADKFIDQLEQEQESLRNELDQRLSYEEFMTRLNDRRMTEERTPVDNQPPTVTPKSDGTATMTPRDIERIVELREQRKTLEQNRSAALSQYAAVNGPNHASKLEQQATELGMSKESLQNLAAQNPKAFYRLTGLEERKPMETFMSPPRTAVNTESFTPTSSLSRDAQYFRDIYNKNPSDYWKPAVQNQIHKAVQEGRLDPADVL